MEALLIGLVPYLIQLAPSIISAFDTTTSGSLEAVATAVKSSPIISTLEAAGAALFPTLEPALQAAMAALAAVHVDNTNWIQNALNDLAQAGFIKLGKLLTVDGIYGPLTTTAVKLAQAALGLPQTGALDDTTYNAIYAEVVKAA